MVRSGVGERIMETRVTLRIFLNRLEEAAELVGNRPADLNDPRLSLYHDALTQRFETVISLIYELLGQTLADRGHDVRIGSSFTWVIRESVRAGLISKDDRDSLDDWVINRHITSHRYSADAINTIVGIVPDLVACGHRILMATSGD